MPTAPEDRGITPGPWAYDGEDIDSDAARLVAEEAGLDHDGYEIFSTDAEGQVDMPIGTALEEGDARLMSASLDLLEVAEDLESWNGLSTAATAEAILAELGPILMKARAAIDKATKGEQTK